MRELALAARQQEAVLRGILKANQTSSLFAQLGLQRLSGFKNFETLYEGFCRAVPVQSPKIFMDGLTKMLPQGNVPALQVIQTPSLLVKGLPVAACAWRGVPLPVGRAAVQDHALVEARLREQLQVQGLVLRGRTFYLYEQELVKQDVGQEKALSVPLLGWHALLGQAGAGGLPAWLGGRKPALPDPQGLPKGGSRWQWFNAMHDQMKAHGKDVEMLVTAPRMLIDFGLYVSQQAGRFVPLAELLPNLKVLVLNHYDIGLQRTELGYLTAGLANLRWMQWMYNPSGLQAWQADVNIRQRLELLADGQIFYEFVPVEDMDAAGRFARNYRRFHAGNVELGREYCVVVSSLSGLMGVSTGMLVKVVNMDPLYVVGKGPVVQLHGLGENLREDGVVEALGNINSALAGHGVFVREALLGHVVSSRTPMWVLELSRPLAELDEGIMSSIAKRMHAELDLRSSAYRAAYRQAQFKPPHVHFVPMGTFAAAFTTAPEAGQFDHSPDAAVCKKVVAAAWESRMFEAG